MARVNTNLAITFDVCESPNCRYITIRDTTGVYDAITNTGGWDSSEVANPSSSNVTEVTVTITDPSGVSYTFDSTSTIPTTSYLPDPAKLLEYPILYSSFGTSGKITDGIYEITIVYVGDYNTDTYSATYTCQVLLACQTNCCLDKLAKEIAKSSCLDCKKEATDKLRMAKDYIGRAKDAVACGMPNMAKKHLAAAQWYCNERNCKSCFK